MSELKVTAAHLRRAAVVYVRQSTLAQVDRGCSTLNWPHCSSRFWPHLRLGVVRA